MIIFRKALRLTTSNIPICSFIIGCLFVSCNDLVYDKAPLGAEAFDPVTG